MPPSRASRRFARSVVLVLVTGCAIGARAMPGPQATPSSTSSNALSVSGPDGGTVYSLAVVATHPITLFASFERGGVFKSVDGGTSWTPADRGIRDPMLCGLTVDPVDPAVLYAECLYELFKTNDGGNSWVRLASDIAYAGVPAVAPSDSRVLYDFPSPSNAFTSRDGGRNWAGIVSSGLPDEMVSAVAIDPSKSSVLYAGTPLGVFKSRDSGATWASTSRGLPPEADVTVLTIDPSRVDTVYAGTLSHGMFRSTSGGVLWTSISDGLPDESIRAVTLGGSTREVLYAQTGDRISRSTDEGDHWVPISAELNGLGIVTVVADPFSPSTLYAGTRAGVYMTIDAGTHWASANRGVGRMSVASLVMHDGDVPTLFAHGDAGTFSSIDTGNTWRRVDDATSFSPADVLDLESDGSGGVIAHTKSGYFERMRAKTAWTRFAPRQSTADIRLLWFAPFDRATMYAATADSLLTTADGGRRWSVAGLPGGRAPTHLAIAPRNPAIVYASTAGFFEPTRVWRSTNGGRAWEHVDNCSEFTALLIPCQPVFDPNDVNTVYVVIRGVGIGGGGDLIRKTIDGGITWSEVGLPTLAFSLTVLPTTPTTLFAQVYDPSDYSRFVLLKSTDRGEQWTASGMGLPVRSEITGIVADATNPGHLFVGTRGRGVFRSLDGGATWEPTSSGL